VKMPSHPSCYQPPTTMPDANSSESKRPSPGTKRRVNNSQNQSVAVSARIISGSVGSLVTALAVTPLEVVKVHLQNARPAAGGASSLSAPLPSNVSLCPKGKVIVVLYSERISISSKRQPILLCYSI
jgi:hypothetical protein